MQLATSASPARADTVFHIIRNQRDWLIIGLQFLTIIGAFISVYLASRLSRRRENDLWEKQLKEDGKKNEERARIELIGALTALSAIFERNRDRLNEALQNFESTLATHRPSGVTFRLVTVSIDNDLFYIAQRLSHRTEKEKELLKNLAYLCEEHYHINNWLAVIIQLGADWQDLQKRSAACTDATSKSQFTKLIDASLNSFLENIKRAKTACGNILEATEKMINDIELYISEFTNKT